MKTKRRPLDFYETGELQVRALMRHVPLSGTIFEPCHGKGAITRVLGDAGLDVITSDIDSQHQCDYYGDATQPSVWLKVAGWDEGARLNSRIDWTVTNPSWSGALPIALNAISSSNKGVAMLLRLSWLEPTLDREELLTDHSPDTVIVLPRYSYTGDGKTDSVTSAWIVWGGEPKGVIIEPRAGYAERRGANG